MPRTLKCISCGGVSFGKSLCMTCYNLLQKSRVPENAAEFECTKCHKVLPIDHFRSFKYKNSFCITCAACRGVHYSSFTKRFKKPIVFPLDMTSSNCPFDGFDYGITEKEFEDKYEETNSDSF